MYIYIHTRYVCAVSIVIIHVIILYIYIYIHTRWHEMGWKKAGKIKRSEIIKIQRAAPCCGGPGALVSLIVAVFTCVLAVRLPLAALVAGVLATLFESPPLFQYFFPVPFISAGRLSERARINDTNRAVHLIILYCATVIDRCIYCITMGL